MVISNTSNGILCFNIANIDLTTKIDLIKYVQKNYFFIERNTEIISMKKFKIKPDISFLLIQRKHSFAFIEFIKGNYDVTSSFRCISHLTKEMTNDERNSILTMNYYELMEHVWKIPIKRQYNNFKEYKYNKIKILFSAKIKSEYNRTTNDWGFPKGKSEHNESNLNAALREFKEETGINDRLLEVINDTSPYKENLLGTDFLHYEYNYYLSYLDDYSCMNSKSFEIGDIKMLKTTDAIGKFIKNDIKSRYIYNINILVMNYFNKLYF